MRPIANIFSQEGLIKGTMQRCYFTGVKEGSGGGCKSGRSTLGFHLNTGSQITPGGTMAAS